MKIQIVARDDSELEKAREICATLSRTTGFPCSVSVMADSDPADNLTRALNQLERERYK